MSLDELVSTVLHHVVKNNIKEIESLLQKGEKESLRQVVRHQISLAQVFNDFMKGDALLAKLLQYEIGTMSALHLAAMLGRDDILMALLDLDIPVDEALTSGTTALHIAAFADQLNTVDLLLTVYMADKSTTDNYGWTALHYASTEGHLNLVRRLIEIGVDLLARDQDGTTAAFRAQTNGHFAVVQYLTMEGDKTLMLTVPELDDFISDDEEEEINAIYARADGFRSHQNDVKKSYEEIEIDDDEVKINNNDTNGGNGGIGVDSKAIQDVALGYSVVNKEYQQPEKEEEKKKPKRSRNLGRGTIRRMVRKEIERALLDSDYLDPAEVEDFTLGKVVGVETMRGIMREELSRVKRQFSENEVKEDLNMIVPPLRGPEEPPYAAIASLGIAPTPPTADTVVKTTPGIQTPPALPPRNANMLLKSLSGEETISKSFQTDPELAEAVKTITTTIGPSWKKLAPNLPIDNNSSKIKDKISKIEKRHPGNFTKQATAALAEWRLARGDDATISQLIVALRKSGMQDTVPVVIQASQEFTA